jgi:hypothetical protein
VHYPFNFDSSSIVKTGDWTKPEENKLSPLNPDVHDPLDSDFGWVPTPTGRRDRIALDVHDIENVINGMCISTSLHEVVMLTFQLETLWDIVAPRVV